MKIRPQNFAVRMFDLSTSQTMSFKFILCILIFITYSFVCSMNFLRFNQWSVLISTCLLYKRNIGHHFFSVSFIYMGYIPWDNLICWRNGQPPTVIKYIYEQPSCGDDPNEHSLTVVTSSLLWIIRSNWTNIFVPIWSLKRNQVKYVLLLITQSLNSANISFIRSRRWLLQTKWDIMWTGCLCYTDKFSIKISRTMYYFVVIVFVLSRNTHRCCSGKNVLLESERPGFDTKFDHTKVFTNVFSIVVFRMVLVFS